MNYDNICPICFNDYDKDTCGNSYKHSNEQVMQS